MVRWELSVIAARVGSRFACSTMNTNKRITMSLACFAIPFVALSLAGCMSDTPDSADMKYNEFYPANANAPVQPEVSPPIGGLHDGASSDGVNPNNSVGR